MRENLEALDEAIDEAKAASKSRKGSDSRIRLQWTKTLRDLVELRNNTLLSIKVHLLGRGESGAPIEPEGFFEGNVQVEFERYFQRLISPWSPDQLKLECQDCHACSMSVSRRRFITDYDDIGPNYDHLNLCPECYAKRQANEPEPPPDEEEEDDEKA
jgi:hypothetical protein